MSLLGKHARDNEPHDPAGYEKHKARAAERARKQSSEGRDIGDLPPVAKPDRRAAAEQSLQAFCESYFPATFNLDWSEDHLRVIKIIETAFRDGGLFAFAMPRGSGKTTLCECAGIWAALYGLMPFLVLLGASEGHAVAMLDSIKTELASNDRLAEDFPEVCHPIRALEGITQRCKGQLYQGEQTRITWWAKKLVLPTMPVGKASGAVIRVAGLRAGIRGMYHKRPDGQRVRPKAVLIDDPQTDESARSPEQCQRREAIINGAVLGLAGPGQTITGVMPCTVIQAGDLADTFLDRKRQPEWQGQRTKMVYAFPKSEKLWEQYAELRADGLRNGDQGRGATEFYRTNRERMDEGAKVAWAARYNADELSAIQHAMNLRLRDEAAFYAEYQNEPLPDTTTADETLTDDDILAQIGKLARGAVPLTCEHVVAHVDLQQKVLYYTVAAFGPGFTGQFIDYGVWPEQKGKHYFTLRQVRRSMMVMKPGAGFEAALLSALEVLTDDLLGRQWVREDGAPMRIARLLIDANWGKSTDIVYQFARQSRHAGVVMPGHGRGIGASSKPLNEYHKKPGDLIGHHWRVPAIASSPRKIRHVVFDANYWKSFLMERLATPIGDAGSLSLFAGKPQHHRMIVEHLTSEYGVKVEGYGRVVVEWKLRPNRENHLLDNAVGCCVAASMQGVTTVGHAGEPPKAPKRKRRPRVSYL